MSTCRWKQLTSSLDLTIRLNWRLSIWIPLAVLSTIQSPSLNVDWPTRPKRLCCHWSINDSRKSVGFPIVIFFEKRRKRKEMSIKNRQRVKGRAKRVTFYYCFHVLCDDFYVRLVIYCRPLFCATFHGRNCFSTAMHCLVIF